MLVSMSISASFEKNHLMAGDALWFGQYCRIHMMVIHAQLRASLVPRLKPKRPLYYIIGIVQNSLILERVLKVYKFRFKKQRAI